MAIYRIEENHLGHVIQKIFRIIPVIASPHMSTRRWVPEVPFNVVRQTGV